jgi:hypothetical protein
VDTHFQPSAETFSKYLEPPYKERIGEFEIPHDR